MVQGMKAKTTVLFSLVSVMAFSGVAQAAETTSLEEVPAAVKQSVDRERGDDPVKHVRREVVDGQTLYLVEIEKNNAPNPRLRVKEDGTILEEPAPVVTPGGAVAPINPEVYENVSLLKDRPMSLSDLPKKVQETARGHAAGREVVDIDREMWGKEVVYEIEFKERGPNSHLYIGEDGEVVRDERSSEKGLKTRFMGTQIDDAPPAVQKTIRRLVDEKEIADIDRKTERGETVYRIEINGYEGRRELKIAVDGRVVSDARAPSGER